MSDERMVTIERTSKSIKIAQLLGVVALIIGFIMLGGEGGSAAFGCGLIVLSLFWLGGTIVARWWKNG